MKELYAENYKISIKEIKDVKEMENYPVLLD